ncbi:hypothetical protein N7471_010312 [Penicillium samsonianum]|uniref:uncharacterized protein n=1 Tax=Penicillium samsonianum TaxID=1882272 RepID=UPI0025493CE9|nr:uncharacterized protein N7471_010312 [Penicillium samsonianum]KAJ6125819.1 hypothetical protein N7471_010312 [Penicillium samsonianum]
MYSFGDKRERRYQSACSLAKCKIVSLDWLLESDLKGIPLSEKSYALGQSASSQPDKSENNGKARNAGYPLNATQYSDTKTQYATKRTNINVKREDDHVQESNEGQKDSIKAGFKSLHVPVDEEALSHFEEAAPKSYPAVLIDNAGVSWDATLNQTVATKNAKKFYRIQVVFTAVDNTITYWNWNRWGRFGEKGRSALLKAKSPDEAVRVFVKKFRAKTGLEWSDRLNKSKNGKYTYTETNYKDEKKPDDDKPLAESQLSKPLQDLMYFIFDQRHFLNAMGEMNYDAKKLPLES